MGWIYKCDDCGKLFDEPQLVHELMGECRGQPAYEDWSYCPYCGSTDFDEYDEDELEEEDE
jgi:DNA-directed RNA polymerase subunit RPC12/RpoP